MSIPFFLGQMVGTAAVLGLTVYLAARLVRAAVRKLFF